MLRQGLGTDRNDTRILTGLTDEVLDRAMNLIVIGLTDKRTDLDRKLGLIDGTYETTKGLTKFGHSLTGGTSAGFCDSYHCILLGN